MMLKRPSKWGVLLLAIFLILFGAAPLLHIANATMVAIIQIIAVAAGVLLWLDY